VGQSIKNIGRVNDGAGARCCVHRMGRQEKQKSKKKPTNEHPSIKALKNQICKKKKGHYNYKLWSFDSFNT